MIQAHFHFETQFSWLVWGFFFDSLSVALFPFPVARKGHTTFGAPGNPHACLLAVCSVSRLLGLGHDFPAMSADRSGYPISGTCLCSGTDSLLRPDATSQLSMNRPLPGHFYTFHTHPRPRLGMLQLRHCCIDLKCSDIPSQLCFASSLSLACLHHQ